LERAVKICVISSMIFPVPPAGYSGLEQLAYQQAEGLAALGHDVAIIAPKGSKTQRSKLIAPCDPGQWDEKRAYQAYWQFLVDFDVIIDNSWSKWAYMLKMEGVLKAPVLGVMHAPVRTMYETLPNVEKPCFVCISQDQARQFEALYDRRAEVCYNGVDPDFYKAIANTPRVDRFLFLARFSSIKGPDIAIQACRQANVGLDLVGDTSITQEPEYLEQCKKMTDGKQIRFVGPATRGECVKWFSQAKALVHPNQRYREPFGLAPVEAMLCGTPVISWDNGAMRETIAPGVGGLICVSFDDLVRAITMIRDHTFTQEQRDACRDWAMKFSIDNMIKRYEELCDKALIGGW
jgi:glycosyltransferase involved in cell wall biosynthesis